MSGRDFELTVLSEGWPLQDTRHEPAKFNFWRPDPVPYLPDLPGIAMLTTGYPGTRYPLSCRVPAKLIEVLLFSFHWHDGWR